MFKDNNNVVNIVPCPAFKWPLSSHPPTTSPPQFTAVELGWRFVSVALI